MAGRREKLDFAALVRSIRRVHEDLAAQAGRAVNISLTLRNWLIGGYIAEFELRGADRASYGEQLLDALSTALLKASVSGAGRRQLYGYLAFYRAYPQIVRTLSAQFKSLLPAFAVPAKAKPIVRTASAQSAVPASDLLGRLSYSHLEQLVAIEDPLPRAFYEAECLRGNWTVRELKRQIGSLYYERSRLSRNKTKLAKITNSAAETEKPGLAVRDPYIFEFIGLKAREVMGESALEDALLDRLQDFLLELGRGFCFEARQKRLLIGNDQFFVDLVFYHRVLKCHVLIELKADSFSHEYLGQLNTYVNWFRAHEMETGDNPPIGILLCTHKNVALVKYAIAGMDNRLFVSKYQLELPKKEKIRRFLQGQIEQQLPPPPKAQPAKLPTRPSRNQKVRRIRSYTDDADGSR